MVNHRAVCFLLVPLLLLLIAPTIRADTITEFSFIGEGVTEEAGEPVRDVTGEAEITLNHTTDLIEVVLTNTTSLTYGAAQLLTGFSFSLSLDGNDISGGTLFVAEAEETIYFQSGSPTEFPGYVDLLSPKTWMLTSSPPTFFLEFHPDADYGILAADYSLANPGITVSPGHNPFVYKTATFKIDGIGLTGMTGTPVIDDVVFYFGTDLLFKAPGTNPLQGIVPLPNSAWMGLSFLAVLGVMRLVRRRRVLRAGV